MARRLGWQLLLGQQICARDGHVHFFKPVRVATDQRGKLSGATAAAYGGRAWRVHGARQKTPWSPSSLHTQTASWCWMKSACVTRALLTVYMLGNGIGKARANDRGQAGRQVQEWRLLFLSTGEKTLAQHMADANKELKAGMEVRMLAVPADASKRLGMFDVLNAFEDAAALSDALKARVAKYYGTPLTAFLHALCAPGEMLRWTVIIRRTVEQFITQNLPASASGQAQRAALRFGLAAAAGELATAFGVTGWPDGTATTAAQVCLHAWLAERGGAGNFEGDAILARLRQVIERFGESRFTRWESAAAKIDERGPRTIDRLGFRKTLEHGMGDALHTTNTYYVLPEAWRSEIFRGMNLTAVNKELLQRGVLEPSSDGKASSLVRLPDLGQQRCYIVKAIPGTDDSEARAA